jgi:Protein of unknown function (DUF4087)
MRLRPENPARSDVLTPSNSCLRTGRRRPRRAAIVALIFAASLYPARADERCGWLENPTPGNWWLKDSHGLWIISAQGGPYAEGVEKITPPTPDRFVATNGQYGYSCACLNGTFDAHAQTMTRVDSVRASPLAICRNDEALPVP